MKLEIGSLYFVKTIIPWIDSKENKRENFQTPEVCDIVLVTKVWGLGIYSGADVLYQDKCGVMYINLARYNWEEILTKLR